MFSVTHRTTHRFICSLSSRWRSQCVTLNTYKARCGSVSHGVSQCVVMFRSAVQRVLQYVVVCCSVLQCVECDPERDTAHIVFSVTLCTTHRIICPLSSFLFNLNTYKAKNPTASVRVCVCVCVSFVTPLTPQSMRERERECVCKSE